MILNPSGDRKSHWNGSEAILMTCMLIALMQRQRRVLALIQQEFLVHKVGVQNSDLLLKDKIVYALIWQFENICFSELSQIHSRILHQWILIFWFINKQNFTLVHFVITICKKNHCF